MISRLIKRAVSSVFPSGKQQSETLPEPVVIPRSAHNVSRANISESALKVLYRLKRGGYRGYLVGGGVRDLLLGHEPKDFDVATDATPEQIRKLFSNCRLIGRRFRLAHVRYGREIIEVATFRAGHGATPEGAAVSNEGRVLRDNVYGSFEEDAWRRDFTVNSLYYDIRDFSVVDCTGGMADLKKGLLRLIGDPEQRYREDPVRMLRAVRFSAKLGFQIEAKTAAPIQELAYLLTEVPAARLYEEVLKLFLSGHAASVFRLMDKYGIFEQLFPEVAESLEDEGGDRKLLLSRAFLNTDSRILGDKHVTPGFLFAALLWGPLQRAAKVYQADGMTPLQAIEHASGGVLAQQVKRVAIPRRFSTVSREIWSLQPRLERRRGRQPLRLIEHPRFRAGYDFLLLRAEAGEPVGELAEWWTDFLESDEEARALSLKAVHRPSKRPRRRRRRPRTRKAAE